MGTAFNEAVARPGGRLNRQGSTVDDDPLVRLRQATIACNEAARIGAAWFREKDNENPETARYAIAAWLPEIEKACLDWSILAHSAEKPLDAIKQAAAAHSLPPIQIGSFSYQTAHEAANARATFVAWCLRGDLEELPEGIATDHVGRIEQEYLQAKAAVLDQGHDRKPAVPEMLTEREGEVDSVVRAEGPLTGKEIHNRTGIGEKVLSNHVIPALKRKRGLVNVRSRGYCYPP